MASTNTAPPLPIDEAVRLYGVLQHFFEVAVHAVLYYRGLYPARAFAAVSAFGVAVHQCRHPAVSAWVRSAVQEVMRQLCGVARTGLSAKDMKRQSTKWQPRRLEDAASLPPDRVNAIAVVVHAPEEEEEESDDEEEENEEEGEEGEAPKTPLPPGAVLERWVFDVRHLPHGWPGGVQALRRAQKDLAKRERRQQQQQQGGMGMEDEADLSGSDGDADGNVDAKVADDTEETTPPLNWRDMEAQMRGVVVRLAQAGQQVAPLPAGCTFTVAVELSDPAEDMAPRPMDARWIPNGRENRKRKFGGDRPRGTGDDRAGTGRGATTTVRSVDCAPLFLECWVEESSVKRAVTQGRSAQLALRRDDLIGDDDDDDDDDEGGGGGGGEEKALEEAVSDSDDGSPMPEKAGPGPEAPGQADPDPIPDTDSDMSYGMDVSFGDIVDDSFGAWNT